MQGSNTFCKTSQEQALPVLANARALHIKHLYDSFKKHGFIEQTLCVRHTAKFWGGLMMNSICS